MITLDTLTLSPHMIWEDEFKYTPVAQVSRRTIGGGIVINSTPLLAGRPITLQATVDQGWITNAMVTNLESMSVVAGGLYALDIHGFTTNVMFRHEEPPAFVATPLLSKQVYTVDDYYTATLKFITI